MALLGVLGDAQSKAKPTRLGARSAFEFRVQGLGLVDGVGCPGLGCLTLRTDL